LLLVGSGIAAGNGVLTHDLALGGQLARRFALLSRRGVDVEIAAAEGMTAKECGARLSSLELSRFDGVVILIGVVELMTLRSAKSWTKDMTALIESARQESPDETQIFVIRLPMFNPMPHFPPLFSVVLTRQAEVFNAITDQLSAGMPNVSVIGVDRAFGHRPVNSAANERWASQIAVPLTERLISTSSRRLEVVDEVGRQQTLDDLDILDSAPSDSFDLIASIARDLFGVPMAAITFIDRDRQWMKSAVGFVGHVIPRSDAFCNRTIEEPRQFVIEDTLEDERFSDSALVTGAGGVRFYAGYPIEAADGHRLGALCVMDDEPRQFTAADASLLRSLALRVQDLLWEGAHL
jgi:hypothetical protein